MIYLDYNATAPLRPEAEEAMREVWAAGPLNASSVHSFGREAKKRLEAARRTVAEAVSAFPHEVIFTASGTEANNLALSGIPGAYVLASAIEHSSVLKVAAFRHSREGGNLEHPSELDSRFRGNDADYTIPVLPSGIVDLEALERMFQDSKIPKFQDSQTLLSLMLANNETGVIQPVAEVARIARKYGAHIHCDAVQAFGKIPVDMGALGVDMLTVSAHKMGGPLGAAALVVRDGVPLQPLLLGGGQERGRRAGTENIAAIAGFARAAELAQSDDWQLRARAWLDTMEAELCARGAVVFGGEAPRLPNTSCIAMPDVPSETQLMKFDLAGFAVSAGSACSSGRIEPSHVLKAMGVAESDAQSAIRVSLGWKTKEKDVTSFSDTWLRCIVRG